MNILHVITSLKIGGAERALCTLLQALNSKEFTHHVAYFYDGPCKDTLQGLGISTYPINGLFSRYDPLAYMRLKMLVDTIKPDLIHTSLWSANILGRLVGKSANIPVVSDLHGNCALEGRLRNRLDQWTAHIPFSTVAVADEVKNAYQRNIIDPIASPHKKQIARQRLIVIKNGIDPEATRTQAFTSPLNRSKFGIDQDAFVVGSVGRLEAIKSYDILIKAFAIVVRENKCARKPVLLLVGDGTQAPALKTLANDLKVSDSVIFAGARTDAYRFYPLFDCFALSSQSEGLSLALLEALCFDLPIITTNKLIDHEVITDGINGFVIPPNDVNMLGNKINDLCNNRDLIGAIKAANRQLIKDTFALSTTVAHYENVFRAALKSSD